MSSVGKACPLRTVNCAPRDTTNDGSPGPTSVNVAATAPVASGAVMPTTMGSPACRSMRYQSTSPGWPMVAPMLPTNTMAIVLVEQYYDFAAELADQYLVMERGEVVQRGRGKDMEAEGVRARMSI